MPIYEYRCPDCGEEFQKLVYGETAVACPDCHNPKVHRTLSRFGIRGVMRGSLSEGAPSASCCSPGACACR